MKRLNQYLISRNGRWSYHRRVPTRYRSVDARGIIRVALDTSSLEIARARRDSLAQADEALWRSMSSGSSTKAMDRYEAARRRAMSRGFVYIPIDDLAAEATIEEIVRRVERIQVNAQSAEVEADTFLGAVKPVAISISNAFEVYCDKICAADLKGKSPTQLRNWRKVKQRAVNNFIALCGDLTMDAIDRSHAKQVFNWWSGRINPTDGTKPLHANSANKDLTNLRILYDAFWAYQGDETRENPFRNLRFKNVVYKDIPPFETDWIRERILAKGALDSLNEQAKGIVHAMVETGCRPSEIANLQPRDIVLDHDVPHIRIRPKSDRALKSRSAKRDVPLLGVSLESLKRHPNGFPRYQEKTDSLSATLTKAFRSADLFPSPNHRIYSLRHAFEKRMLEAGLDYGLRCSLMGHYNNRPEYGDGGSLTFRRDELRKITIFATEGTEDN